MYVYQIVYPKGLELVQPSECTPNLSYHGGDLVWYYCNLPRHNNDMKIELNHLVYALLYLFS